MQLFALIEVPFRDLTLGQKCPVHETSSAETVVSEQRLSAIFGSKA